MKKRWRIITKPSRLNPKYVLGYKNRAALYDRMGDKDRAAADREQAKTLDPKGLVRGF